MFRPNNSTIFAKKPPKVKVKIGDIVSFANVDQNTEIMHKITSVRKDLVWSDVVNAFLKQNVT